MEFSGNVDKTNKKGVYLLNAELGWAPFYVGSGEYGFQTNNIGWN